MDMTAVDITNLIQLITGLFAEWGLKVLGALALLIFGRWIAGRARNVLRSLLSRADIDPTLVPFLSSLAYWVIMAMVIVAVLGMVGVQTASLLAVFGAAGLAIGLALQGTLSNLSAGVMLLMFRPFDVDDYVDVGGTAGTVIGIGLFSTTLHTPDNVKIILPNSQVYGGTIKNFSANDTRRLDLVMGISYDDDIGKARGIIERVLSADARVLRDPEVLVEVGNLGDSSVDIFVRPWCRKEDYWPLKFHLLRTLKEELEAGGCSIPYPQRDVHLHQAGDSA
jgi:small conductance mechanosensitive channel